MAIHLVQVQSPPRGGGCTRGVLAERFKTPLVGGVARLWRLGGNLPAPAFPGGETGKGSSDSLRPTGQSPPRLTAESVVRHPPRKSLLPLKSRNSRKSTHFKMTLKQKRIAKRFRRGARTKPPAMPPPLAGPNYERDRRNIRYARQKFVALTKTRFLV